jgi:hypothetical protein
MRRYYFFLAWVCISLILAGCRSASGPDPGWQNGTHTVRSYAAMSMPAFLPDGSKYVVNGARLLKFSAGDVLLDTIELPQPIDDYHFNPKVIGTAAGSVFVTLGDGRVGLLDTQGLFQWLQDFGETNFEATAFGEGILARCYAGGYSSVKLIGTAAQVKLELSPTQMLIESGMPADVKHVYFTVGRSLSVADTAGNWLLRELPIEGAHPPWLICAAAGRVLMGDGVNPGGMICRDVSGKVLWSAQLPDELQIKSGGLMLADGTVVLSATDYNHQPFGVLFYSPDGMQLVRLAGFDLLSAAVLDQDRFAAQYAMDNNRYFGVFTNAGDLLWGVLKPAAKPIGPYDPWEDYTVRANHYAWCCGPDQRIYYDWESTLFALDAIGNQVWRETGHEYTDKQVPNSSPMATPSPGGTGAGGKPVAKD